MDKIRVGIVGCGIISECYIHNLKRFPHLDVVACADLDEQRARNRAAQFQLERSCSVKELLADSRIDLVVNLTIPKAHLEVSLAVLEAGKHLYSEKPLGLTIEEAQTIIQLADAKALRVGCAPDTVLGAGIQTCRKLIDDGWIGRPLSAVGFMMARGPETWHPNPEFLYKPGGGPMYDMGPYYLAAFVHLLGPFRRVTGSAIIPYRERLITSEPNFGKLIDVEIPSHIAGVIDFHSGAVSTLITSFDIPAGTSGLPFIEIYGQEGTLRVPNPSSFGGPVRIRRHREAEWSEIPLFGSYTEDWRGLGIAEMGLAIQQNTPFRANHEMAYHIMEAMHGFHVASQEGQHYCMNSICRRPEPFLQQLH